LSGANPEDLLLLDDLLGIADPEASVPDIDPDARAVRPGSTLVGYPGD
jgi:hypothetical protein